MHVPAHFAADDPRALLSALVTRTLPHLVTTTAEGMVATPVPLLYDAGRGEHGTLLGHLARANPQWRAANGTEALVIVLGADAYISPNWYASKQDDGRVVPTWNYEAVHAYGPFVVRDDAAWKHALVRRLTDVHELTQAKPWSIDDAPSAHIESRLSAVVGFEIAVTRLVAKQKLSQNRPAADVESVIGALANRSEGERDVSDAMSRDRT
jgi:transcriptional regulator